MAYIKITATVMLAFCLATIINTKPIKGPSDCCCSNTTAVANRGYCNHDSDSNLLCTTERAGPTANVCDFDGVAFDYFNDEPKGYPECPTRSGCADYCSTVPEGYSRDGCLTCCLYCCTELGD